MNSAGRHEPQPNAEDVYAEWARNGGLLDFDDLCRRHPEIAAELGRIHQSIPTLHVESDADTETLTYDNGQSPRPRSTRKSSRYRIQGKLAQGGMGVVYTAWDDNLNRDVALKLIREGGSKESQRKREIMLARFLREAEITGQLDHPGVVPVHEIGQEASGRVFFSMRLVRGESLKAVFEKSRNGDPAWSTVRVLDTLVNVCQTLAFAHSRGIIHRDLKPDNIMVGEFGETYVMDWGLAKRIRKSKNATDATNEPKPADDETIGGEDPGDSQNSGGTSAFIDETLAGSVLGTPSYMPPEQAAGRIEQLDETSDIYSVGTLLYELIAGHRPYADPDGPRGSHEIVKAVTTRSPKRLAEIRSDFPGELIAICEKAMAREQSDRYQKMDEMAADLQAFLENRVVRAYQTGVWAELKKFVSRNKAATISAATAMVLAIGASIWIATIRYRAERRANQDAVKQRLLSDERKKALDKEQLARKAADAQRTRAEGQSLALQSTDRLKSDPGLALLLAVESHKRHPGLLANNALLAALRECREVHTLVRHQSDVYDLALSPDGSLLVTSSSDKTAIVWDMKTGKPTAWLVGHHLRVRRAMFTLDGKRIITASYDKTAAVWDAQTGKRLFELRGHSWFVRHIAISPDGKWIATSSEDGTVRLWGTKTGKPHHVFKGHKGRVWWSRFSPDGKTLLTAGRDGTARVWNVADGNLVTIHSTPHYLSAPLQSKDGFRVLGIAGTRQEAATYSREVKAEDPKVATVWDPTNQKAVWNLKGHSSQIKFGVVSSDSKTIVTGDISGEVRLWNAANGNQLKAWSIPKKVPTALAVSPDGRWVAAGYISGLITVWDAETGDSVETLAGHSDSVLTLLFVPGGDRLISGSADGTARVWRVTAPGVIRFPDRKPTQSLATLPSPDGKHLTVRARGGSSAGIYTIPEGKLVADLKQDSEIVEIRYSPNGRTMFMMLRNGEVRLWDAKTYQLIDRLPSNPPIRRVLYSAKGDRLLAVAPGKEEVIVWHLGPSRRIEKIATPGYQQFDFATGGNTILAWSGTSNDAECIHLGNPVRRTKMKGFNPKPYRRIRAAFSPNGDRIVTWTFATSGLTLWDTRTGKLLARIPSTDRSQTVRFNNKGDWFLAAARSGPAHLCDTKTGRILKQLPGQLARSRDLHVAPGGRRFITRSHNRDVRLWDRSAVKPIALLGDGNEPIDGVEFDRSGRLFLSGAFRGSRVSMWDAETGSCLARLSSGEQKITDYTLTGDGRTIVTATTDGLVRIDPFPPATIAKRRIPRDFTPDEWTVYGVDDQTENADYRRNWVIRRRLSELFLLARAVDGHTPPPHELTRRMRAAAREVIAQSNGESLDDRLAQYGESKTSTAIVRKALAESRANDE